MDVERWVLDAVSESLGTEVSVAGPTARGESGSTFDILAGDAGAVLKVLVDGPGVLDNQHRLVRLVGGLRGRGYPAPEYLGVGAVDQIVFTVQLRLPGDTLEPGPGRPVDPAILDAVTPEILDAVELQRDAGDLTDAPWPEWLLRTTLFGGEGYCLHEAMQRRWDTASLLDRVVRITRENAHGAVRTTDVVHFDLNPANIVHEGGHLSGVVDWNVPFNGAAQGDRGFDLATLLFYTYDNEASRARLWEEASAVSGPRWTKVYLAHLVLRQVEWTARHRPGTTEEHRFMDVAALVLRDCERIGA